MNNENNIFGQMNNNNISNEPNSNSMNNNNTPVQPSNPTNYNSVPVQPSNPTNYNSVPVQQPSNPVNYNSAPVQQPTSPVNYNSVPVQQPSNPTNYNNTSVQPTSNPVNYNSVPVQQPTSPVNYNSAPVQQPSNPVNYNSVPVQQPTSPVNYNSAPVQPTNNPVNYNSAPVQPSSNSNNKKFDNLKKMMNLKVIIAGILVILILVVAVVKILSNNNSSLNVKDSTSFFLENNKQKVALFNKNGKKLTKFEFDSSYTDHYNFLNHVSIVRKGEKKGLLNDHGKYLLKLGNYKKINRVGYLYEIEDSKGNKKIVNSLGKTVYKKSYESLESLDTLNYNLFILKLDNELKVMNYNGKIIDTIRYSGSDKEVTHPKVNRAYIDDDVSEKLSYELFVYNNKTYIYDLKSNKKYLELDGSYLLAAQNKKGNKIVLSKSNGYSFDSYYIYSNKKIVTKLTDEHCARGVISIDGGYACINDNYSTSLYDEKGNKKIENVVTYKNIKNYVYLKNTDSEKYGSSKKTYVFYSDGKVVEQVFSDISATIISQKVFSARVFNETTRNGEYYMYDYYGKKFNSTPFTSMYKTQLIDDLYIVSSDGKTEYVINESNKELTQAYDAIKTNEASNYMVSSKDDVNYLLNENQKVLVSGFNRVYENLDNIVVLEYNDYYEVYDLNKHKVILKVENTDDNNVFLEKNYFYVYKISEEKKIYYTNTKGNKFYQEYMNS